MEAFPALSRRTWVDINEHVRAWPEHGFLPSRTAQVNAASASKRRPERSTAAGG